MKKLITSLLLLSSLLCAAQDGILDRDFGVNGTTYYSEYYASGGSKIVVLPDGKIVQNMTIENDGARYFGVVRYNKDGIVDNTYGTNGLQFATIGNLDSYAYTLLDHGNGKVLVAGSTANYIDDGSEYGIYTDDVGILQLNNDGSPDVNFGSQGKVITHFGGYYSSALEMIGLNNGQFLVSGTLRNPLTSAINTFITKYNADGSVDQNFGDGGSVNLNVGGTNQDLTHIALTPDGKIMAAGSYINSNRYYSLIMRFKIDGSPDNTFGDNGKVVLNPNYDNTIINAISIQNDGKMILAGNSKFYAYQDYSFMIMRLLVDGTPDISFNGTGSVLRPAGNTGASQLVSIKVQKDGKILIAGNLSSRSPITQLTISDYILFRFTATGELDPTFTSDYNIGQPGTKGGSGEIYLDLGNSDSYGYIEFQDKNILISGNSTFQPAGTIFELPRMTLSRLKNSVGSALPVTLTGFTAKKIIDHSLLEWQTAQEINSAYFDIERSPDALVYEKIGSVVSTNKSGGSNYNFTDNNVVRGFNYYRLKQVDKDGKSTFSPTRMVQFDQNSSNTIQYYPNPTRGMVNIEIPLELRQQNKVISICNAAGKVLDQIKIASNGQSVIPINLGNYPKGIYMIQVKSGTTNSTQRIVLQ